MSRIMYDAIRANAQALADAIPKAAMVAYYATGSPDIRWTDTEKALFPGAELVSIDQGYTGSPAMDAMVRDVESGAWSPASATDTAGWTAERRTIYCTRSTIPLVLNSGWKEDVWLAYPGWMGANPPSYPGASIVAVQNTFLTDWDVSIVYDPYWPRQKPSYVPDPGLTVTVASLVADIAFAVHPDASHYVVFYTPAGAQSRYLLARPGQPVSGSAVNVRNVLVNGPGGGAVSVYAIVNAQAIDWGKVTLP